MLPACVPQRLRFRLHPACCMPGQHTSQPFLNSQVTRTVIARSTPDHQAFFDKKTVLLQQVLISIQVVTRIHHPLRTDKTRLPTMVPAP